MHWVAAIFFWISWSLLTLVCGGTVFLTAVFSGDNPANRARAERLMTIAFILLLAAIAGGITSMILLPDWRGWLIACAATLFVPIAVLGAFSSGKK